MDLEPDLDDLQTEEEKKQEELNDRLVGKFEEYLATVIGNAKSDRKDLEAVRNTLYEFVKDKKEQTRGAILEALASIENTKAQTNIASARVLESVCRLISSMKSIDKERAAIPEDLKSLL